MRKTLFIAGAAALALSLAGLASPASAANYTLTFDQSNACDTVCGDGTPLSANYGSEPGVTVSYQSWNQDHTAQYSDRMYSWDTGYGDLTDVAYAAGGDCCSQGDIVFTANHGATFTLNSWDFAAWPHVDRTSSVRLYDLSHNLLADGGSFTAPGQGRSSWSCIGCTTTSGFMLEFGPSAYNVGIDNVNFTVTAGNGVPEPAAWALMLVGFGSLGAGLRSRRKAAFA